jgi:hypothetical protein
MFGETRGVKECPGQEGKNMKNPKTEKILEIKKKLQRGRRTVLESTLTSRRQRIISI